MTVNLSHFFPSMLPSLASLLVSASLIILITRFAEGKKEFRLLAACCMVSLFWNLARLVLSLFSGSWTAALLVEITRPLPVVVIPLVLHLVHRYLGVRGNTIALWIAYILSFLMIGVFWIDGNEEILTAPFLIVSSTAGSAYVFLRFFFLPDHAAGRESALNRGLMAAGSVLFLAFPGLDALTGGAWGFGGFAFVPLVLISSAMAARPGDDPKTAPTRENLLHTFIMSFVLFPLICDLLFVLGSVHDLQVGDFLSWRFHHTTITAVSLLAAAGCALFSLRKVPGRIDALLYVVICLLVCVVNLRDLIITGLPEDFSRRIILINDIFLVNLIGICGHLVLIVCRKAEQGNALLPYVPGLLLIPLLLYESRLGASVFPYGIVALVGLGHFLFIAMFVVMMFWCIFMLVSAYRREQNPSRRRGTAFIASGIVSAVLILAGSMMTTMGLSTYPFYNLAFISLMLMGYGLFYSDIRGMGAQARRQTLSQGLRLLLSLLYLATALGVIHILKDYPVSHITDSIIPYGIPPLLSFLGAGFLSLFVLGLERNRPESQLFSLISFCYTALNLDIFLQCIVTDHTLALIISRIDHFFLALLLLGVNIHLVYLVIGKKDRWWVVYAAYFAGLIMAPLTQTDLYFEGVHSYFFGLFAKKAAAYDIMSALWGAGICYSIFLLYRAFRNPWTSRRARVRHTLTAFIIIAVLSITNNPAIYGYEIYPLGSFIFFALFFLAYGLFKFNLKIALQYIRIVLFWLGLSLAMIVAGFSPGLFLHEGQETARALTGILLVVFLFQPAKRGWNAVLDLFMTKSDDMLKDSYYTLTGKLSRIHHRETIHQMLYSWFFENIESLSFASLFSLPDLSGRQVFFGWKTWNARNDAGLFADSGPKDVESKSLHIRGDHPLIKICRREQMLCTQESLVRMNPSIHAFDGREGLLKDSEVIIPVISKGELLGVMLPGRRADGSHYSHTEFDIFQNISLVLGPLIENAMLLEGLEEKVNLRTRELNRALAESVRKGQELRENSDIIGRQNKIFRTLLETSTRIHHLDNVDDLFSFILSQLHTLFSDFRGGIILENRRRGILEAMSFLGISEAEQKVILELREEIMTPEFGDTLNHALFTREIPASASDVWTVFPMEGRESGMIGYLIFKGQELDRLTKEIFAVFLGQLSAVTQNKLLMIQLERMASTDGLTGLYNRAFLNQELKKVIDHARRYKNMHFSIMIVDVNGLKRINDTYGHEKGDEAIVRAGRLLRSVCRQTDVVARLGGDEFAILMPSTSLSQAEILYGRIYQAASTLKISVSRPGEQPAAIPVRMSVGLACSDDTPPDMVMKKADALMYNVKKQYYASMKTARG